MEGDEIIEGRRGEKRKGKRKWEGGGKVTDEERGGKRERGILGRMRWYKGGARMEQESGVERAGRKSREKVVGKRDEK